MKPNKCTLCLSVTRNFFLKENFKFHNWADKRKSSFWKREGIRARHPSEVRAEAPPPAPLGPALSQMPLGAWGTFSLT